MHHHTPQMLALQARLETVTEYLQDGRPQEAWPILSEVKEACGRLGLRSSAFLGLCALAHASQGEFEAAFVLIREAVALDAFNPSHRRLLEEVAKDLREALASAEASNAPTVPRLYALLADAGETDLPCHLAMARYQEKNGQLAEAEHLLEALTTLLPAAVEAWQARRELARARGDERTVATCDEALARATTPRFAFAVPETQEEA